MSFRNHTSTVMWFSKHQLSAALKRKCLDLNEKITILDYANEHRKMGCRKLAEHFSIRKKAISNILKESKNFRIAHEFVEGNYQKVSCNQWNLVQMVRKMHKCKRVSWQAPCFKGKEAMEIGKWLEKEELTDYIISNGWLER